MCQEANDPQERLVAVFSACSFWRRRQPASCPDCMSRCRCSGRVAAPHTSGGSVARKAASPESGEHRPLRPRNVSVPACRPTQRGAARSPCASEVQARVRGSPRQPCATLATDHGAGAGVPITGGGLRVDGLGAHARSCPALGASFAYGRRFTDVFHSGV